MQLGMQPADRVLLDLNSPSGASLHRPPSCVLQVTNRNSPFPFVRRLGCIFVARMIEKRMLMSTRGQSLTRKPIG